jgi:DNA-directed RNA polymerase subunit RPC12/RpoP
MEYRLGNSKEINEIGNTSPLVCPKCNKKSSFMLLSNGETRLSADFPFVSSGTVYFLVCPECSSVFGIDEDKGDLFKKDKLVVGNFDFKELKPFEL